MQRINIYIDSFYLRSMAIEHNCELVVARTLHDAYNFIGSLQHRGRDAVGIAAVGDDTIDVLKWAGGVKSFDKTDLHRLFDGNYHTFLAHVRYATRGNKDRYSLIRSAHPVVIGGEEHRRNDHIIIRGCDAVAVHNGQVANKYFEGIDLAGLKTDGDSEKLLRLYQRIGIKELVRRVPGAYTLVIADRKCRVVMAIRDRTGIRPGFLGFKDTRYIAASEDIVFQENGGVAIEEMTPGIVYYFSPDGKYSIEKLVEPVFRRCFFEWNYIASASSNLNGINVLALRRKLGEKLAEEFPLKDVDFVTFVPRCPEPAARSYAAALELPFRDDVFYKKNSQRAFLGPNAKERKSSIEENLHLKDGMRNVIGGKRIVVIDDSTISGNNAAHVRELLYEVAGVKEAHLINYTPPVGIIGSDGIERGCEMGVDRSPQENPDNKFIARNRTIEQISAEIGMPVHFISVGGMLDVFRSFGISEGELCTFCVGGQHPLNDLESRVSKA